MKGSVCKKHVISRHIFIEGENLARKTKKYHSAEGEKNVVFERPHHSYY